MTKKHVFIAPGSYSRELRKNPALTSAEFAGQRFSTSDEAQRLLTILRGAHRIELVAQLHGCEYVLEIRWVGAAGARDRWAFVDPTSCEPYTPSRFETQDILDAIVAHDGPIRAYPHPPA